MVKGDQQLETDTPELPEALKSNLNQFLLEIGAESEANTGVERARYEAVAGYIQESLAARSGGHQEIDTWSGETVTPLDPDPADLKLDDIAHGLANLGRFAGQGREFYSVARHSVHVSLDVKARDGNMESQRYALVHDAAEAYLSDVPGPVKKSLPGYKHAERRLDAVVMDALGLEAGHRERELVEGADKAVNKHELSVLFPDADHEEPDYLHHDPDAVERDEDDKELFLRRARDLKLQ